MIASNASGASLTTSTRLQPSAPVRSTVMNVPAMPVEVGPRQLDHRVPGLLSGTPGTVRMVHSHAERWNGNGDPERLDEGTVRWEQEPLVMLLCHRQGDPTARREQCRQ